MRNLLITVFLLLPILTFAEKTKYDSKTGKTYKVKTLSKNLLPKWKMKKNFNYIPNLKNQEYTTAPDGELYLPAEFAKMEAILVQPGLWDTASIVYYKELIKALHDAGTIPYIITKDASEVSEVTTKVLTPSGLTASDVRFLMYEYDAVWTRDYGPWNTYLEGERVIVDMKYHSNRPADDEVPILLGAELDEDVYKTGLSTEGGNFMSDGFGTCWISEGVEWYNPDLSVTQIKDYYKNYVGCNTVTIVPPLPDEGTTHIDMFSKILNQDTIMVGFSTIAYGAEQKEITHMDTVAETYRNSPKPDGKKWNIIRVPMTFDTYYDDYYKEYYRVYYTHTNSLVVNNHVLVPTYKRGTDAEALEIYKKAMPEYNVVGIDTNAFIPYGGAIHCTTMQIPLKEEVICGNGIIEEDKGEECEDNYFNGKSCADFSKEGKLSCTDCKIDSSTCTAPKSDRQEGICKGQVKVYSESEDAWLEPDYTQIENYEANEVTCDGLDNDCDGLVDNNLVASLTVNQNGVCLGNKMVCKGVDGWQEDFTQIETYEYTELTCDGLDNDCDGKVDNNLIAELSNVNQKGVCAGSKMVCNGTDGWQEGYRDVKDYSDKDDTNDGLDNNCDGQTDESYVKSSGCNYESNNSSASLALIMLFLAVVVIRKRSSLKTNK